MTQAPILFEDFQPGVVIGECVQVYDAEQAQRWQAIFSGGTQPQRSAAEGSSMAVIGMMRAYLQVVTPRPPGNVHARQKLRMYGVPQLGESIRVSVHCSHKEMRRERRYVDLQAQGVGEGDRPLFDGLISLIWAA